VDALVLMVLNELLLLVHAGQTMRGAYAWFAVHYSWGVGALGLTVLKELLLMVHEGRDVEPTKYLTTFQRCLCAVAVHRGRNEAAEAADRERFLQELEEDAEMRARVALFKDSTALAAAAAAAAPSGMAEGDDSDDDDADLPQVSVQ
jgi:hypothetical protein